MNTDGNIFFLVTKNYDAMRQFFIDLGLDVIKGEHPGLAQVTPLLNQGRGCMIFLPSLLISLEECTNVLPLAHCICRLRTLMRGVSRR